MVFDAVLARSPMACRTRHQWMAFVDADEFIVIRDPAIASLPQLLREYADYGALVINWQVCCCSIL